MSDFDRYANSRSGAGIARSDVDQGLRAYMISVYNYMTLGLGATGLVAYAAFALGTVQIRDGHLGLTDLGHAIYVSLLRWIIVLSPLALVFYISARINSMSVASARIAFIAFIAFGLLDFCAAASKGNRSSESDFVVGRRTSRAGETAN
jgi:uncharacterized protein